MVQFRYLIAAIGLSALFVGASVAPAQAIDVIDCTGDASGSEFCKAADADDANPLIQDIINLLLFLVGVASVIVIVIGGFQYVTSNGDSSKVTTAKNTVLYAVIGLIVAILATLIVNTILDQFV